MLLPSILSHIIILESFGMPSVHLCLRADSVCTEDQLGQLECCFSSGMVVGGENGGLHLAEGRASGSCWSSVPASQLPGAR